MNVLIRKVEERTVRVLDGGLLSTVQGGSRRHVASLGVSPSGPADWLSAIAANRLVENDDDAAVIETTLNGAALELQCDCRFAVTGADAPLEIGGMDERTWLQGQAPAGSLLVIGNPTRGLRCYVALEGGIAVPPVFGSSSTDVASGFGGFEGRRLIAGDVLRLSPCDDSAPAKPVGRTAYANCGDYVLEKPAQLRVLPGPHAATLPSGLVETLFERSYRVSIQSNRQGMRLEGEPLDLERRTDVVSAGLCAGCVQIASNGLLTVMLAEHQTTGGYACVLCVISADLPRAGQLQPGDELRFVPTSHIDAVRALRTAVEQLPPTHRHS